MHIKKLFLILPCLLSPSLLLFILFITGACVLVLEISATRMLSPFFGNTIYTVSSVITVILLALSMGYSLGGRLADKYPLLSLFYTLIFISGVSVFLLFGLSITYLPFIAYLLPLTWGPLLTATLLFLLPNFFLGMLSPFVVKLHKNSMRDTEIGTVAGDVFFWSTLGSIVGSLSTGFFLIPYFGITTIILSVAITLSAIGFLGITSTIKKKKSWLVCIAALVISTLLVIVCLQLGLFFEKPNTLYSKDGMYEKITVYDDTYNKKPTRFFLQDKSTSGARYLDSREHVYDYTKYYQLYKIFNPNIQNALVIGGAAYTIPKALLEADHKVHVDVSEIEPATIGLAKKYFELPTTPRLTNDTKDGRRMLYDTNKNYDLIFSDVYYSLYSIPSHFTTKEFFELTKKHLQPNGIFVANIIGTLSHTSPSLLLSEINTFKSVYPNSYFFATSSPTSLAIQNIVFVGYNSSKKLDIASMAAGSTDPFIVSLPNHQVDPNRFIGNDAPLLTDNYVPIEKLTASLLKEDSHNNTVDGKEVLGLIQQQTTLGARFLSSPAHSQVQKFIASELKAYTTDVTTQRWQHIGAHGKRYPLTNIIAHLYPKKEKRILLGTHYDSKRFANNDLFFATSPVGGANDSASGTALLLELARVLATKNQPAVGIDLVFFDGEEGEEDLDSASWHPLGSEYFASHIDAIYPTQKPFGGIIVDMICDSNLQIYQEKNSLLYAPSIVRDVWNHASKIPNSGFIKASKYTIFDDHSSLAKTIPSILLIDFDYPYFHTTADTIDKCSSTSLEGVGNTIVSYIYSL